MSEVLVKVVVERPVVPGFLTSAYFESILRKFNRDDTLKVSSVHIGPCGAAGDAFASTMYRVEVRATQRREESLRRGNYVVKMMPSSQLAISKLGTGSYDVHEKEMELFQNVFPEFSKILGKIDENINVFPKAMAVDRVRGVLIMEDLAVKKFLMVDRKLGLDIDHIKLSLVKLAKFHAASMVMMDKDSNVFESFDIGMFSRNSSAFNSYITTHLNALTTEISTWTGFEALAEKLEAMKKNFIENTNNVFDNEPGDLQVLIHGDLWTNNLMFTYDKKGSPRDAIIIDFQFCCVAHPAVDLLYFLHTSSVDEIRQTKIQELVQFYFYELKKMLIALKYDPLKIPTLHQFQLQVLRKYFYAFTSTMTVLPLMLANDPESNFENVHSTNDQALAFKKRLYKNQNLRKIIEKSLLKFDHLGLLDDMV